MEDSVPGAESLLRPVNLSSRDGVQDEEEEEDFHKKEHEAEGGEERTSGFINHLISNLVTVEEAVKEKNEALENEQKETVAEVKVEERRVGLLDHLISNLVSPLSPKARELNQGKGEVFEINDGGIRTENEISTTEENVASSPGGGGLIKHVISNFFHLSEADEVIGKEKNNGDNEIAKIAEENDERLKTGEEAGGGSIIDNIVSHLPTSLREDVEAPTTDEASILIHSIVHD